MSELTGSILSSGFSYPHEFTFTRAVNDNADYTDAVWRLYLYDSARSTDVTPLVSLSSQQASEILVTTNNADSQAFTIKFSSANLTAALNNKCSNVVGFQVTVQPTGESESTAQIGQGWEGTFTVQTPNTIATRN